MNKIGQNFMINNGLDELAANAVELVVDERTAIAYAVYLSSKTAFGESNELVNLAKFNILQPTNVNWVTVFDKNADFGGAPLSECNIIELDREDEEGSTNDADALANFNEAWAKVSTEISDEILSEIYSYYLEKYNAVNNAE